MPVSTLSAAVHITPVVFRTFKRHFLERRLAAKRDGDEREEEAQDDIFFDERVHSAFHIVRAFIELGTKNKVESLQAFTNTHVPAPYWAAVAPVCIPFQSCNASADILIDWFGPEELKAVVGGERWWQVRGLDGVDGEWITQKDYLSAAKEVNAPRKLSDDEHTILRMEKLERVMLYVHGGGYFWGSINTHRYQLIRYARKIKGRVFAVNYRPLNTLGLLLYRMSSRRIYISLDPRPVRSHQAIPPSKIVLAGDSAGGGLCLSTLAILRDMGIPLPSGAVLISPWVDLTHSFPSVMQNTETDIIPQHGFLAKPSTLWPVDPLPTKDGRAGPAKDSPPPEPGHADQLRPTKERVRAEADDDGAVEGRTETSSLKSNSRSNGAELADVDSEYDIDYWEPRAPRVQMDDPQSVPLELHAQIQLYATTEQLTHPLVSPILQGSLGNLPPLYILAGNDEVLRDEIVYIAHRAAYPDRYPTRKGALRDARRQQENVERYTQPTKVHLQVFDDMCHVLTVFTFTESAKHAYRSIAAFVKHVTDNNANELAQHPFPELKRTRSDETFASSRAAKVKAKSKPTPPHAGSSGLDAAESSRPNGDAESKPVPHDSSGSDDAKVKVATGEAVEKVTETTAISDTPEDIRMIRERVDIEGAPRPMEPQEEMSVLQLKSSQIGIIKEAPTIKWLKGQEEWDKKYKTSAEKAVRQRLKLTERAKKIIANAREPGAAAGFGCWAGAYAEHRRWGPLDLEDERPPATAIAKRLDTARSPLYLVLASA
ncbi:Alpha/Beta hydrolase protein [Mycena filopes]|nr:Alpha/Beta hydrolase protein [Mycena filopes]